MTCQVSASRLRNATKFPFLARARANAAGDGDPALQHDRQQEQDQHERDDLDQTVMQARASAQQLRHLGDCRADHGRHGDAANPNLDIGRRLIADAKEPQARI